MVGLDPAQFGVDPETLEGTYLYAVAYLDASVRSRVEETHVRSVFDVAHVHEMPTLDDWREVLPALEVQPPDVVCYFVTPKPEAVAAFQAESKLSKAHFVDEDAFIREFVSRNTHALNVAYYTGA